MRKSPEQGNPEPTTSTAADTAGREARKFTDLLPLLGLSTAEDVKSIPTFPRAEQDKYPELPRDVYKDFYDSSEREMPAEDSYPEPKVLNRPVDDDMINREAAFYALPKVDRQILDHQIPNLRIVKPDSRIEY